jgi:hypothetical protein
MPHANRKPNGRVEMAWDPSWGSAHDAETAAERRFLDQRRNQTKFWATLAFAEDLSGCCGDDAGQGARAPIRRPRQPSTMHRTLIPSQPTARAFSSRSSLALAALFGEAGRRDVVLQQRFHQQQDRDDTGEAEDDNRRPRSGYGIGEAPSRAA